VVTIGEESLIKLLEKQRGTKRCIESFKSYDAPGYFWTSHIWIIVQWPLYSSQAVRC